MSFHSCKRERNIYKLSRDSRVETKTNHPVWVKNTVSSSSSPEGGGEWETLRAASKLPFVALLGGHQRLPQQGLSLSLEEGSPRQADRRLPWSPGSPPPASLLPSLQALSSFLSLSHKAAEHVSAPVRSPMQHSFEW